ncbi:nucleotidyltransferase domain-containing protein [Geoalkalibacter halelectricus]|uniref:Nucleotidyltransferase domain-containing protein n=1 Tax=Geoalkalibacter halelectricus TaxID=2847045 RepID=A0ABY5ZN97_9BACT|nr:nucleotidyltransferase domain-containing protein [Geoalkalibacter halelectricus]MDO3378295.1 nucleotidyltransferase domain-containing protein [Geoalkalibacter halelectricus]UWZ79300.1 nucleotidyltransferase domain-containing protein [Geoalkalibacter halelectricus]
MLAPDILMAVKSYLAALRKAGVDPEFAVVFGSQVSGRATSWSDIDVLVVAPQFDSMTDRRLINLLWRLAARVDSRIEPIPCGSRQWRENDSSAIIEVARRTGEILSAA